MEANNFKIPVKKDVHGDAACCVATAITAALAIGETIDLCELPAGSEVYDLKEIHDALGASSQLEFGYRYKFASEGPPDSNAFLASAATATAGSREGAFHPVSFDYPVIIMATVSGAAVTGQVTAHVKYRFIGPK